MALFDTSRLTKVYKMKYIVILVLILSSAPAFTDERPTFFPFTIGEKENAELMNALQDVPLKYAVPVLRILNAYEERAKAVKTEPAK